MSAINIDNLTRLMAYDPNAADNASSSNAGAESAFSDYLQRAQTPGTNAASSTSQWSSSQSGDSTGFQSQPSTSVAPQADSATANDPPASPPADRGSQTSSTKSSSQQQAAAPASPPQNDSSSPTATKQDTSATSQGDQNQGKQDSGSAPSDSTASPPADSTQEDDSHKVKKIDAAAVSVDISTAAIVAASVPAVAGGTPANGAPAATPPVTSGLKKGGDTAAGPITGKAPQTISAAATAANGQAAAQASVGQASTAQATADSALPPPKEMPASSAAATPTTKSGNANAGQDTAAADAIAAAAAGTAANTASTTIASPPADLKPAPASGPPSALVGGVRAVPTGQVADTAASAVSGLTGSEAALTPEVQTATEQRASAAVDAIAQSDSPNETIAATAKPGNSTSAATAVAPQTTAQSTNAGGTASGASATADTSLSQADRVRFVQRVEQAFQDLSGQGGTIRLRLSPPELGSLHIEISLAKGQLTARVEAETPAARNLLLDNLPALRERLAQQDIKVQRFDVDLMDRSGGGMSNQSSQYQNPSPQNSSGTVARSAFRNGSGSVPSAIEAAPSRPASGGGQLNVVV
jgi:flagellar hook-length control protein FliK